MPGYAENLPQQCPPDEAIDGELASVYRLVANEVPTADDFLSKAARGDALWDGVTECDWASCSLFKKEKSLPSRYSRTRQEYPYVVELNIPKAVGKHKTGKAKRGHVDFWRYSNQCLSTYVTSVKGLSDDES